jgi:hypothetical protein
VQRYAGPSVLKDGSSVLLNLDHARQLKPLTLKSKVKPTDPAKQRQNPHSLIIT